MISKMGTWWLIVFYLEFVALGEHTLNVTVAWLPGIGVTLLIWQKSRQKNVGLRGAFQANRRLKLMNRPREVTIRSDSTSTTGFILLLAYRVGLPLRF